MNVIDSPLKKLITSNLYTRFSGILSLSDISLFLVDISGDILLELIPSPDFCSHVCLERDEHQVCSEYKNRLKPDYGERFICKYGLENILLPIKLKDETLGYIAGMQVYTQGSEYKKFMIDIQTLKIKKKIELEFIAKSIASLKTVEQNKIKIHEQLCHHISSNITLDLSESASLNPHIARLSIEKEILEKKIIDLEAKNMSLVINPHFLFNTLNCIARIAYFEKSHTTEELIYCLSDLLRYNLKQADQLHTIATEIDNVEKYLHIQKVRFKNRLEYTIDIPDCVKIYRIPNMVIQPIVENAIIHGITPMRDGGKVSITADKRDDNIVISVVDNGIGFTKDVLNQIQQPENKSGLGFRSTDLRLKQYYGDCYGLEITKTDFRGSTITITIPTQPIGRC